ncbi:MAG: sigma-70 family RNA polymerase sigma factor, partial [Acidobacteriota bacterium]
MTLARSEITHLLDRWTEGETEALAELMPKVVSDLRNIASNQLSLETPGHTLQPTALVNELYLRLVGKRTVSWQNRAQFFAFVARMMRRILVDHARSRRSAKRGAGAIRLSLDDSVRLPRPEKDPDLLALDDALEKLEAVDPQQSRLVELRYFTGLSVKEIAEVEGISPTTVKRYWRTAKMWLYRELRHS